MALVARRGLLGGGLAAIGTTGGAFAAPDPQWEPWRDLVNFLPDQVALEAQRRARGRPPLEWEVQRIENARKPTLNMDQYEVVIARMPSSGPAAGGPAKLYEHIRRNLETLLDPEMAVFRPHLASDGDEWAKAGPPPAGCMMLFGIKLWGVEAERGAVTVSATSAMSWRFSPVRIGRLVIGSHPVAGNREFALRAAGGAHVFVVRAADRAFDATPTEAVVLDGAKTCWRAFQQRLVAFINGNGGQATMQAPRVLAPAWEDIVGNGLFTRR